MPILPPGTVDFLSRSPEQTHRLGFRLGQLLMPSHILCLSGDLGAGKTTFAAGLGEGWGAENSLTSPTFVIVHEHQRPADSQRLYHLDAYRITSDEDAETIGLEDILDSNGAVLIEWWENIQGWLPTDMLKITFSQVEDEELQRRLTFKAGGEKHQTLLDEFKKAAFGA